MNPLEDAIDFYCSMLSELKEEANPHDDTRLYTISYYSYKTNIPAGIETFLKYLKLNEKLNKRSDEDLRSFAENRIKKINYAKYILTRIPGWIS
jgi:hypothetical protein